MILSCNEHGSEEILLREVKELMDAGRFSLVLELPGTVSGRPVIDDRVRSELDSMADYARRYMIEFPYSAEDIIRLLASDSVDAGEDMLREWEKAGDLEYMWIDGERRYFRWAHRNLYRINDSLRALKQIDRQRDESLFEVCAGETDRIIRLSHRTGNGIPVNPKKMKVMYTISVDADAVPPGEVIRCWMPFPRDDSPRLDSIVLVKTDPAKHLVSPGSLMHRSIYFEKEVVMGEPTVFFMELEFRSWSTYFDPAELSGLTGNGINPEIDEYTVVRPPHIRFSEEITTLASSIVKEDMSTFEKARAIYLWINDNIIWTSALEYGLMTDIPGYVLSNMRGDCGMQTLLFISLCRASGIPAKWQSGWMMHPGHVNLHDWSEIWIDQAGWIPVDVSFKLQPSDDPAASEFYISGIDSYRLIVNDDYGRPLYPEKIFPRSEPVDFQRGELEWNGGNIYFDKWKYNMQVEYK